MPSVASETTTHALKHTSAHAHRPRPAPDRAPPSPFEDLVDDAAPPEQPAPGNEMARTARSDSAQPPATPNRSEPNEKTPETTPDKAASTSLVETIANAAVKADGAMDGKTDKAAGDGKPAGDGQGAAKTDGKLAAQIVTLSDGKPADGTTPTPTPTAIPDALPLQTDVVAVAVTAVTVPDTAPKVDPAALPDGAPPPIPTQVASAALQAVNVKTADRPPPANSDHPFDDATPPDTVAIEAVDGSKQQVTTKTTDKDADKLQVAQARNEAPDNVRRFADASPQTAGSGDTTANASNVQTDGAPPPALTAAVQNASPSSAANPLPAPQSAPQATPIPLAGIAVEIAGKALAGKNRFEIRLDPPELGRIEVRLDVDRNGNVTSRLVADRADTLDLLRRDASGLERALQDAGLKTADNGLQFSLRDQSAGRDPNFADSDRAQLTVDDGVTAPIEALQYNYNRTGRPGGLDIRV